MGFQPFPILGRALRRGIGNSNAGGAHVTPMSARILNTQSANLIGYWPLNDPSGTNADDKSTTNADGTYTGTFTLAQPGIGDGSLSTSFGGGRVSLATPIAALAAVFSGNEGSVSLWCNTVTAVWTDSTLRAAVEFGADVNNRIMLNKTNTNNTFQWFSIFGGTSKGLTSAIGPINGWFHVGYTWSKSGDLVKGYLNGLPAAGISASGLGTFAGSLSSSWTAIADFTSAGSSPWAGNLAHVALWKVALTAAEMARIGVASAS